MLKFAIIISDRYKFPPILHYRCRKIPGLARTTKRNDEYFWRVGGGTIFDRDGMGTGERAKTPW